MGGLFSKGKKKNTSNDTTPPQTVNPSTDIKNEVVNEQNDKIQRQNQTDFHSNKEENMQDDISTESSLEKMSSEAVGWHKNSPYALQTSDTSDYKINELSVSGNSNVLQGQFKDDKENVPEVHRIVYEKIRRDSFKQKEQTKLDGVHLNSKTSINKGYALKNNYNKRISSDFQFQNVQNTSHVQSSFHSIKENKSIEIKRSSLKPKWVLRNISEQKQNPEVEFNEPLIKNHQNTNRLNPFINSAVRNISEVQSTVLKESKVVNETNVKPDISSEMPHNFKQSEKKRLLRAPPPSEEVGSVLVQRITGVGDSHDLISYNTSGRPSSSYYVAPAKSEPNEDGDVLPPYNDLPFSFLDQEYDHGLGPDAGIQDVSAVQLEEKPLFDSSTVLPAADWLDIDFSRSTYLNDSLTGRPEDVRKKFNFEDYNVDIKPEEKNMYVKILENIDAIPNLGEDPATLNAFWTKETILRILEKTGRYDTVYYDEFGNEYSLRSSKPSYALADWAKDYLTTVRPPNAPEPRKRDMNDYRQFFDKVDKSFGRKGREARQNKMQAQQQAAGQKGKSGSKQSVDTGKKKSPKSETTEMNIGRVDKSKRKEKLNIVPKEREEEIYNTLTSGGDVGGMLESLMTPENQMRILEEIIKPPPDYATFTKDSKAPPIVPDLAASTKDSKPPFVMPDFTNYPKDTKQPSTVSDITTFSNDTKPPFVAPDFTTFNNCTNPPPVTPELNKDTKPEEKLDSDLENIYEILLGDSVKEKKKIYQMMRDPVGRETVFEALCRIGTERYPEYYESLDEEDNIYPGATSILEKRKKLLALRKKKRPKREIVIQTYPFPDDLPKIDPSDKAKYAGSIYDSDAFEYSPEKQEDMFETIKMHQNVYETPVEQLATPDSKTKFAPNKLGHETGNIDDVISSLANHSVIKDTLKTPGGRERVFEALCRVSDTKNPQTFNP